MCHRSPGVHGVQGAVGRKWASRESWCAGHSHQIRKVFHKSGDPRQGFKCLHQWAMQKIEGITWSMCVPNLIIWHTGKDHLSTLAYWAILAEQRFRTSEPSPRWYALRCGALASRGWYSGLAFLMAVPDMALVPGGRPTDMLLKLETFSFFGAVESSRKW